MKLNNHFLVFSGLFFGISSILFLVLQKYLALFLHHTITFCQEMARTVLLELPNNFGMIITLILTLLVFIAVVKFTIILVNMWILKRDLYKNIAYKNYISTKDNFVIINSSKPFAFCFGIIKPKVYISSNLKSLLTKRELRVVVAHENYHLKSHDTRILLLANIFESLFPYFPIISDTVKHYRIERELRADQFAILESGGNGNKDLINILKKLLKFEPKFSFAGIPSIAEIDTLEPRINKLVNNYDFVKKFKFRNLIISFISVIILATLAIVPVNTSNIHSEGDITVILCVDKKMSSYYTL